MSVPFGWYVYSSFASNDNFKMHTQIHALVCTPRHVTLCSVHVSDGGGTWIDLVSEGGWYWFSGAFKGTGILFDQIMDTIVAPPVTVHVRKLCSNMP